MAREHGTRAKAVREGCECVACRVAAADYERERRIRRRPAWRVRKRRGTDAIFEVVDREGREVVLVTRDHGKAEAEAGRRRYEAIHNGDPGPWSPWASREELDDLAVAIDGLGLSGRRLAEMSGLDAKTVRATVLAARSQATHRPRRETVDAILSAIAALRD